MTIGFAAVRDAAARIAGRVHRTPVWTCRALDDRARAEVFLKCESFQRIGAFKIRGATNVIASLSPAERARGVITHSSGNHAQAVALAAASYGSQATVVMPTTAPAVKRAATRGYGATVVDCQPTQADREATVEALRAESGAVLVHPYDDDRTIAGQGTAALELLDQIDDLDAVVVPVGGGGLAAGSALVCAARGVRLILAEPAGADDACRSLETGVRVTEQTPNTIADGLLTCLGERNFDILRRAAPATHRVDDAAILDAMRLLYERAKLVVEPSGAVPVAAALVASRELGLEGRRVGVIVSGGNIDLAPLWSALAG